MNLFRALMPLFIGPTLIVSLPGCDLTKKNKERVVRVNVGTPLDYRLDDPACQEQDGLDLIGAQTVHVWDGSQAVEQSFNIPIGGKGSASSSLIDATYFGYHQRRTMQCTADADGRLDCDEGETKTLQRERHLKLCRPDGAYARDSIEDVTLASLINLERAKAAYQALPGARKLATASLLVLPNYEQRQEIVLADGRRTSQVGSDTDNAAFAPIPDKVDDALFYVVFPRSQSAASDDAQADMRLWEVPWVMAHEFSHQIFYTHYRAYHVDSKDDDDELRVRPEFSLDGSDRVIRGASSALTAVNEGFADALGAQLAGPDRNHAQGLPCFEQTRDVKNALFADGTPKALTAAVRDEYFGSEETTPVTFCGTWFQDSHHVGAIFAHGMERLLAADAQGSKGAQILAWLDAFNTARQARATVQPEDVWLLATKALIQTARNGAQTLTAPQCEAVKAIFPLYAAEVAAECL